MSDVFTFQLKSKFSCTGIVGAFEGELDDDGNEEIEGSIDGSEYGFIDGFEDANEEIEGSIDGSEYGFIDGFEDANEEIEGSIDGSEYGFIDRFEDAKEEIEGSIDRFEDGSVDGCIVESLLRFEEGGNRGNKPSHL